MLLSTRKYWSQIVGIVIMLPIIIMEDDGVVGGKGDLTVKVT